MKRVSSSNLQNLRQLREDLLHLHKVLLDVEKFRFQRTHRQKFTAGQLYQIILSHKDFAWLRQLSELIIGIDELLENSEIKNYKQINDLIKYVKILLKASKTGNKFSKEYYQAIQQDPAVALCHAKVMKVVKNLNF